VSDPRVRKGITETLSEVGGVVWNLFVHGEVPDGTIGPGSSASPPSPASPPAIFRAECPPSCPRCAGTARVVARTPGGEDVIAICPQAQRVRA